MRPQGKKRTSPFKSIYQKFIRVVVSMNKIVNFSRITDKKQTK